MVVRVGVDGHGWLTKHSADTGQSPPAGHHIGVGPAFHNVLRRDAPRGGTVSVLLHYHHHGSADAARWLCVALSKCICFFLVRVTYRCFSPAGDVFDKLVAPTSCPVDPSQYVSKRTVCNVVTSSYIMAIEWLYNEHIMTIECLYDGYRMAEEWLWYGYGMAMEWLYRMAIEWLYNRDSL